MTSIPRASHPRPAQRGAAAASLLWGLIALFAVPAAVYVGHRARRAWDGSNQAPAAVVVDGRVDADASVGFERAAVRAALREAQVNAEHLEAAIEAARRWTAERSAAQGEEAMLDRMLADAAGIPCTGSQREDERLQAAVDRADADVRRARRMLEQGRTADHADLKAHIARLEAAKESIVDAAIASQSAHARIDRMRQEESVRVEERVDDLLGVLLEIEADGGDVRDRLGRRLKGMTLALNAFRTALRKVEGQATSEADRWWLRKMEAHVMTFRRLTGRAPSFQLGMESAREVRERFNRRKVRATNLLRVDAAERCGPSRSEVEATVRDVEFLVERLTNRIALLRDRPSAPPTARPPSGGGPPSPSARPPQPQPGKHPWSGMKGKEVLETYPGALLYGFDSPMYGMTLVFRDPYGKLVAMSRGGSGRRSYDEQREFGAYEYVGPKELPPGSPWKSAQTWRKKRGGGTKWKYFR